MILALAQDCINICGIYRLQVYLWKLQSMWGRAQPTQKENILIISFFSFFHLSDSVYSFIGLASVNFEGFVFVCSIYVHAKLVLILLRLVMEASSSLNCTEKIYVNFKFCSKYPFFTKTYSYDKIQSIC